MTVAQIIMLGLVELVAAIFIARLWIKRRHKNLIARLIWSVVLLIPVFGILTYFFVRDDPDSHPYDTDTTSAAAEAHGEGRGDHF